MAAVRPLLVIADTGPINYLVLTGDIAVLPVLFDRVILPATVRAELASQKAPGLVRDWIARPPTWLEVHSDLPLIIDALLDGLDDGERAAIALASAIRADLLLMDDRDGVMAARNMGLRVTGTLGVLDLAAERGLLEFGEAIEKLKLTSFRRPEGILAELVKKHQK